MTYRSGLLILVLLIVSPINVFSDKKGESKTYYVMSKAGLHIRSQPDKSSKSVKLVPFAAKILITVQELERTSGNDVNIDGLTGTWIQGSYDGKAGFVFSGYLSQMPVPKTNHCVIDQYFKINFGIVEPDTVIHTQRSEPAKQFGSELKNYKKIKRVYGNEITLIQEGADDFWFQVYTFKNNTIQELFHFGSICMKTTESKFALDEKKSMQIYGEGACSLRIYLDAKNVPTLEWACSG